MDGHSTLSSSGNSMVSCSGKKRRMPQFISQMPRFLIDDLDESLLMEILYRITHTKSLICCMLVSKRWSTLVSDSYLLRRRLLHHHNCIPTKPQPFSIMFNDYTPLCKKSKLPPCRINLNFLPCAKDGGLVYALASCNDLILCYATVDRYFVPDVCVYYICNPSTKQYLALPPIPRKSSYKKPKLGLLLNCCPLDQSRGNCATWTQWLYKVVCIYHEDDSLFATTFSSDMGRWSELVHLSTADGVVHVGRPVVHDNRLHWPVSFSYGTPPEKLLVYDSYSMKQWQLIDCPRIPEPKGFTMAPDRVRIAKPAGVMMAFTKCFGSCCGLLRMLVVIRFPYNDEHRHLGRLEVWDLQDYKLGKWNMSHKIYFDEMKPRSPWFMECVVGRDNSYRNLGALVIHQNDSDIVFLKFCSSVVMCNVRTRRLRVTGKSNCRANGAFPLLRPSQPTLLPSPPQNAV